MAKVGEKSKKLHYHHFQLCHQHHDHHNVKNHHWQVLVSAGFDPALGCPEGEQRVDIVMKKCCKDNDDDGVNDDNDGYCFER